MYWGGVPQYFGRVCCSIGPQQLISYCIFKKEFSEILGSCCSMGFNFSRKISQQFHTFSIFFQEINFLRLYRSEMVRFGKTLMKSPINLHTGRFQKISKSFENLPPKLQKIIFYCILRNMLFGSKKSILCYWDPQGAGPSPPKQFWIQLKCMYFKIFEFSYFYSNNWFYLLRP